MLSGILERSQGQLFSSLWEWEAKKLPKRTNKIITFFPFQTSWLPLSHLNLLVGPWLIFDSHLFPRSKRHEFMRALPDCVKELNLAASPALRRLFGRVIDAVGSAVAGTQDVENLEEHFGENPVHGSWLKQAKALVLSVTSTVEYQGSCKRCPEKGQHLPLDKTFEPGHEQDGSCSNGTWPSSCHLEPSICRNDYWHCLTDVSCTFEGCHTCKIRFASPVWCGLGNIQQQPTPLHCKNL